MLRLDVQVTGEASLYRGIRKFERKMSDYRPAFSRIADLFREEEAQLFESEGRRGRHGRWESLSEPYASRKARHAPGAKILVLRGRLKASLTEKGAPGSVEEMTADTLTLGTTDRTAVYHQFGTKRMPRRKVIDLRESSIRKFKDEIRKQLSEAARELSG